MFIILIDYKVIPFKYISDMKCHTLIHFNIFFLPELSDPLSIFLSDSSVEIIVLRTISLIIPQIVGSLTAS